MRVPAAAPFGRDGRATGPFGGPGAGKLLQQTLRLLGASRVAFMRAEANQSLRRALQRKTRSPGVTIWAQDTAVYYWNASVSAAMRGFRDHARVGGQVC